MVRRKTRLREPHPSVIGSGALQTFVLQHSRVADCYCGPATMGLNHRVTETSATPSSKALHHSSRYVHSGSGEKSVVDY